MGESPEAAGFSQGQMSPFKTGFMGIYWIICGGILCCTADGQDCALLVEVKEAAVEPYDGALS